MRMANFIKLALWGLCTLIVAWLALPYWVGAQMAADQTKTFQSAKPAVVKISVDGSDPNDNPKHTQEGSGFIVYSEKGNTLIITAAHVIGSSQTERINPDWHVNDLEKTLKRTIKVEALDANDVLAEHNGAVVVLGQDDQNDIAVLSIQGSNFKSLEGVYALQELQGKLSNVLALGYKKGEKTVGFHPGTGKLERSQPFPFSFNFDSKIDEGRSGGPILDTATGKVIAIISRDLGRQHRGVPVAFARPILEKFFGDEGIPTSSGLFIDSVRWVTTGSGLKGVELLLRNSLGQTAQVSSIKLELLNKTKPQGGLQTSTTLSATYIVRQAADKKWESVAPGDLSSTVKFHQPFASNAYTILNVPVAQTLKGAETDRIVILLDSDSIPGAKHNRVQATAIYDGTKRSRSAQGSIP